MTKRINSAVIAIAAMALIAALGTATPARANPVLQLSTNGTVWTPITLTFDPVNADWFFNSATSGWSTTGIQVKAVISSDKPGSNGFAELYSDITLISPDTGTSSTKRSIFVRLGDTGFNTPHAPPGFIDYSTDESAIVSKTKGSGTTAGFKNNTLTVKNFVDPNNVTLGMPSVKYKNPDWNPTVNVLGGQSPGGNPLMSVIPKLGTSPYGPDFSMTHYFAVTLGRNAMLQTVTDEYLQYVPEPSSLAVAGLGALGMLGYLARRRKVS